VVAKSYVRRIVTFCYDCPDFKITTDWTSALDWSIPWTKSWEHVIATRHNIHLEMQHREAVGKLAEKLVD
jgi:hypothetical protein